MRILKRVAAIFVFAMVAFYGADYMVARKQPLGSVQVQPYLAVPQKNGKTEFIMQDPETDTCVQSILPHMGQPPCWKLNQKKQKRIDM